MKITKERRELILNEIEKLNEAGVKINVITQDGARDKKESGFARIQGHSVYLTIYEHDPIDLTISNIVEAGELINEANEVKNHERNHPNLFVALLNRGYGGYYYNPQK